MTAERLVRLVRRDQPTHQIPAPLVALDQSLRGAPVDEHREAETLGKARETLVRASDLNLESISMAQSERADRRAFRFGMVVLHIALLVGSIVISSGATEWWAVTVATATILATGVNLSRIITDWSLQPARLSRGTPAEPRSDRVDRNHA